MAERSRWSKGVGLPSEGPNNPIASANNFRTVDDARGLTQTSQQSEALQHDTTLTKTPARSAHRYDTTATDNIYNITSYNSSVNPPIGLNSHWTGPLESGFAGTASRYMRPIIPSKMPIATSAPLNSGMSQEGRALRGMTQAGHAQWMALQPHINLASMIYTAPDNSPSNPTLKTGQPIGARNAPSSPQWSNMPQFGHLPTMSTIPQDFHLQSQGSSYAAAKIRTQGPSITRETQLSCGNVPGFDFRRGVNSSTAGFNSEQSPTHYGRPSFQQSGSWQHVLNTPTPVRHFADIHVWLFGNHYAVMSGPPPERGWNRTSTSKQEVTCLTGQTSCLVFQCGLGTDHSRSWTCQTVQLSLMRLVILCFPERFKQIQSFRRVSAHTMVI